MSPASLSIPQSENYSNGAFGPNSLLVFRTNENASVLCATITNLNLTSCLNNTTQITVNISGLNHRTNVNVLLNSTDMHGNQAVSSQNFTFYDDAPSLLVNHYIMASPGYVNLDINSSLNYTIEYSQMTSLNGSLLSLQTGTTMYQ